MTIMQRIVQDDQEPLDEEEEDENSIDVDSDLFIGPLASLKHGLNSFIVTKNNLM